MRALKPPEQMGMLMSADSASSYQGCHGEKKARDGAWGCGGTRVIRWVGEHYLIRAGEVLITDCEVWGRSWWVTKYFLRFGAGRGCSGVSATIAGDFFHSERGGKARFSSGWDPVCHRCQPEIRWLWSAQPRAMFWDSLEVHLEPGCCLLNRCFSCKQCKHTPTAKLAAKLAAEQIETCTIGCLCNPCCILLTVLVRHSCLEWEGGVHTLGSSGLGFTHFLVWLGLSWRSPWETSFLGARTALRGKGY